jgi:hypothetical protein
LEDEMNHELKTGIIFILLIFSGLGSAYLLTDHSRPALIVAMVVILGGIRK